MKKYLFPLFVYLLACPGCKTIKPVSQTITERTAQKADSEPETVNWHDQTTWILGYFIPEELTHYPYSEWYNSGYNEYQIKTDALIKLLGTDVGDVSITVVMGTWCPDSRREVPRFMKVLDNWQFPSSKLTFIGVDEDKQSPIGDYTKLNIKRVPTFIIYKNNIETGRIIENPLTSLEQDLVNILAGMSINN